MADAKMANACFLLRGESASGHIQHMASDISFSTKVFRFRLFSFFLPGLLFLNGCGKQVPNVKEQTQETAAAGNDSPIKTVGPGANEKFCFVCNGNGAVTCTVVGCANGQKECPGPCLKLTRGTWIRMQVAGHDPNELWQKFPNASGKGGYKSWSQGHVGEVIAYQNGVAVNIGQCKVCSGTTKVTCADCRGTGQQTCQICEGKKFIPDSWAPTDNPWFNRQPDIIRLADGRALLGRIGMSSGDDRTIVTRDKKIVYVKASEILPKGTTTPPVAQP